MLVQEQDTNASPFYFKGLEHKNAKTEGTIKQYQENNRERVFRRAGNSCEIAAAACLNSTVIFTFHLLQINNLGFLVVIGVTHFYFTATALGEKSSAVVMVGCAGSLSCLCALSEPVGEWWEAKVSVSSANEEINRLTSDKFSLPGWYGPVVIALLLIGCCVASRMGKR